MDTMTTERAKARQGHPMTNAEVYEDIKALAAYLCTDEGKAEYRREYDSEMTFWLTNDTMPTDPGEYREEMKTLRRNSLTGALGSVCSKLNLRIGESVVWGEQDRLTARMWATARNPGRLADKLYNAIW